MTIFERVQALGLPDGEYAVFSGGLMEALGLRSATDIDLVVTPKLYERLKAEGWNEIRGANATTLIKGDIEVALPEEYVPAGVELDHAQDLWRDPLMIGGVAFSRPEYVIACKRLYQNPKHYRDIELLEKYLLVHPEARKS